jgi:hypothetical protein
MEDWELQSDVAKMPRAAVDRLFTCCTRLSFLKSPKSGIKQPILRRTLILRVVQAVINHLNNSQVLDLVLV